MGQPDTLDSALFWYSAVYEIIALKGVKNLPAGTPSLGGLRRFLNHFSLLQLFQLGRDDDPAIALAGIVVVVFLVIILGLVESLERHDLCDDGMMEIILRLQL